MKITVYHIKGLPIDKDDRMKARLEWKEFADKALETKPAADDIAGWEKINEALNVKEDEIKAKYPWKAEWSFDSLDELSNKIKELGTISLCEENGEVVAYLSNE